MKDSIQELVVKLQPVVRFLRRYLVIIVFLVFAILYIGLVIQIDYLAGASPSDAQVNGQLESIKRPKIDQQTLDKIQQLQDQNIQVRTLFDQARNNPFGE